MQRVHVPRRAAEREEDRRQPRSRRVRPCARRRRLGRRCERLGRSPRTQRALRHAPSLEQRAEARAEDEREELEPRAEHRAQPQRRARHVAPGRERELPHVRLGHRLHAVTPAEQSVEQLDVEIDLERKGRVSAASRAGVGRNSFAPHWLS